MKKIHYIFAILLLTISTCGVAMQAKITQISLDKGASFTLNFQLTNKTDYRVFLLQTPNRLVVDFNNATNGLILDNTIYEGSPIKSARNAIPAKGKIRYVFDLNSPIQFSQSLLKTRGNYLLKINLTPSSKTTKINTAIPAATPAKKISTNTAASPTSQKQSLRNTIIVLDPGHGGHDPGATGSRGTHEKNITLAISLKLKADLETLPGVKVYLTRTNDTYPTLGQRLTKARKVDADMYISIHADAYQNRAAHGVTIFALSQGRATSEAARWIAERENKSELLGGVELNDKSYMLRSVLVDLSQTATIGSSLKLGASVLNSLGNIAQLHSTKVEQASLYVLTSPDIPAILVETGFISNRNEEQLLRSSEYQSSIAMAIKKGVEYYLLQNPIPNTIFSAKISDSEYIAKAGDTINSISSKYNVSAASLRSINTFEGNKIVPGQVVRIPTQS